MALSKREYRKQALNHLRHTYISLYLLPWEDKTPSVRNRMRAISEKFNRWNAL